MKQINNLFAKFEKLLPPNDAVRKAVATSINEVLGTKLTKVQVRVQNAIAFVDCSSIVKNKIRIERKEILDLAQEKLPKGRDIIRDIR
ncbi:MAG: hypothetical protein AAB955_00355 [Patescibacteria group bacterium]